MNWRAALITFWAKIDIQIMNCNGFKEPKSVKRRLMKKHQVMLDFLENKFHDYWEGYRMPEMPEAKGPWKEKIWICWMKYDKFIDYLLTDYAIVLAQKHIKHIADLFADIQPNNTYCDELYKLLGQPYDEETWKHICKDTMLYKLTWKQSFPKKKNGEETFYGRLLNGTLDGAYL